MQKFLGIILVSLFSLAALAQPENTTMHEVQSGETKYGISRQYGISIERLEKFNPDIKAGLKVGMTLLIPPAAKSEDQQYQEVAPNDSGFVKHEVQAKETLFSLSQTYGASIAEIKANNPQLQDGLKVGQILMIPVKKPDKPTPQELAKNYHLHKVKPKETAWSISQQYNISLDSLYLLNPEAETGLRIGQLIKLPKNREETAEIRAVPKDELATDEKKEEDQVQERAGDAASAVSDTAGGYLLYKIKTGDSFYALKKRYNVSQDELVELNPEVASGLEVGKYIIIPKKKDKKDVAFFDRLFKQVEQVGPEEDPSTEQIRRRDSLNLKPGEKPEEPLLVEDTLEVDITKTYRVALMLPFYADRDSLIEPGTKVNSKSVYALDFYNGFLMAADSLSNRGMNLTLEVWDTENSISKINGDLPRIRSARYDLVVGPLYKRNVEHVAQRLQDQEVPVISPLSSTVDLQGHPNLVKCIPGQEVRIQEVARLINEGYEETNIIFVEYVPQGGTGQLRDIMQIKARLTPLAMEQSIKTVSVVEDEDQQLDIEGLKEAIVDSSQNVIVVLADEKVFLSTVVGALRQAGTDVTKISMIAPSKIMDIPTLDLNYLNALNLTMPDMSYINYRDSATVNFIAEYRDRYKAEPSRFAFQGYDVGLYFLRKLWRTGPFFLQAIREGRPMLSTGFRMEKSKDGGYENTWLYVTGIRNFNLVKLKE